MLTKAEIMERAELKVDLSILPAEALEKMNEMFNGDYAGAMAETDAAIEKGVDLYLSAVGRRVEVLTDGKAKATTLQFTFRGSPVTLYPYSGWFTGKTVKDGRGIMNLLKQIPMRWALRRQEKIKAAFEPNGDDILTRIKESLTRYFSADRSEFPDGYREIEDDFNQLPGEPYPTIAINDVGNDSRMIEFYVTGKQYDVFHLAFKGFTKC